ncbi:MAG: apolipoprotein N-acyltransferase [Armatimonadota bacterium]
MRGDARLPRACGALTSGFLLVLVFPGPDLGWIAWIALVPLLLAVRGVTPSQAFRLGFLSGLVAYGGLMDWIRLFGTPAWIMLAVGMAGFMGAFAAGSCWLVGRYQRSALDPWLWAAPLTWTAVEVVRSVGPLAFPWGLLGLTQHRASAILPLASVVGVFGIGTVIALANVVLAKIAAERRVSLTSAAAGAIVVAVLAAVHARPVHRSDDVRVVAVIQPNVDPRRGGDATQAMESLAGLLEQAGEAKAQGAEMIVFPETALPSDLGEVHQWRFAITHAAGDAVVVAGTFFSGPRNGVLVLDTGGKEIGRYAKRRLVPFGEAGVVSGAAADPIGTRRGIVAPAVCYESAFPDLIRPLVAAGADLITILTNDGWFGRSAGPAQHAAHSVLRAAETGRSVARAANTGTSMLIRPDGTIVGSIPLGRPGVLAASLPIGGPLTPYVQWGWLLGPLAVAGWLAAAAPSVRDALRQRRAASARLLAAIVFPGAVVLGGRVLSLDDGILPLPVSIIALVVCAAVAPKHLLNRRGVWASVFVSLVATGALVLAMRAAYMGYGFDLRIGPPDGMRILWLARYLLHGVAIEVWLRGAVFAEAVEAGGWPLAIALSTALGVALQHGGRQEMAFWYLFSGVGYGAIRAWTRDAAGLGPARGLGDVAVRALAGLR